MWEAKGTTQLMSDTCCGNCARPVADGAALCATCSASLSEALKGVPGLLDDLLTTLSKQDRLGTTGGKRGKGSEQPLPVRLDIHPVIAALGNILATWARDLVERNGWDVPDPPRRVAHNGRRGVVIVATTAEVDLICYTATWLADHVEHLRKHPAALEAHRGITNAIAGVERVIDRPPVLAYRGPCVQCGIDLHAAPSATTVTCQSCDAKYDGAELRARLLYQAADQLVTTVELSAALTGLSGTSVPIGTIRSWRSRGQLAPHAWLHDDRMIVARPAGPSDKPLFRVGEAVALLEKLRAS